MYIAYSKREDTGWLQLKPVLIHKSDEKTNSVYYYYFLLVAKLYHIIYMKNY